MKGDKLAKKSHMSGALSAGLTIHQWRGGLAGGGSLPLACHCLLGFPGGGRNLVGSPCALAGASHRLCMYSTLRLCLAVFVSGFSDAEGMSLAASKGHK